MTFDQAHELVSNYRQALSVDYTLYQVETTPDNDMYGVYVGETGAEEPIDYLDDYEQAIEWLKENK